MDISGQPCPEKTQSLWTKKRRRRAIDPSIGYYVHGDISKTRDSSGAENKDFTGGIWSNFRNSPLGLISDTRPTSSAQPENTVTVDRFLRMQTPACRPAGRPVKLKDPSVARPLSAHTPDPTMINQLQLRSRIIPRDAPSADAAATETTPDTSDGEQILSTMTRRARRQKKRSFGKRIYEAAIAIGVNPINDVIQPKGTLASKVPLCFQPDSPIMSRRARGDLVVPDRRSNPFREAPSFIGPITSKPMLPMMDWLAHPKMSYGEGGRAPERPNQSAISGLIRSSTRKDEGRVSRGVPLQFVPLAEAEDGYNAMFAESRYIHTSKGSTGTPPE